MVGRYDGGWREPMRLAVRFAVGFVLALGLVVGASAQGAVKKEDCPCRRYDIIADREQVAAGDVVRFRVVSDDAEFLKREFRWGAVGGKVISGQGSLEVRVRAAKGIARVELSVSAIPMMPDGCECVAYELAVPFGARPIPKNMPAEVRELKLSAEELVLACPPGHMPGRHQPSASMVLDVSTAAFDAENDLIAYRYTVSGGRIVGEGAQVKWDLSDVPGAGTYRIDVGADDGSGVFGGIRNRLVTVLGCEIGDCFCPTIGIAGPETVEAKATVLFTANVEGGTQSNPVTYEWAVTGGRIVEGQGTPWVKVLVAPDGGPADARVRVKIGGLPPCHCLEEVVRSYKNGRLESEP